jgi:Fe2+ transport system protein FeoA
VLNWIGSKILVARHLVMFREEKSLGNYISLCELRRGERALIVSTEAKGEIRKRLLDMGVVKGVELKVIRKAPLGDPIEIQLNGFMLSLRKEEARHIYVEKKIKD